MQEMNHGGRRQRAGAAWAAGLAGVLLMASIAEASPARVYRVKPGDTLSGIAWQQHGAARKWVPLYRQNRQVVGSNPHLIFPGQRLVLLPDGKVQAVRAQAKPKPPLTAARRAPVPEPPTPPVVSRLLPEPRVVAPIVPAPEAAVPEAPVARVPAADGAEPMAAFEVPASAPLADQEIIALPESSAEAHRANAWVAAGASTLIPGAGQAYLGNWGRGSLYAGAAALLYGAAQYGVSARNEALTRTGSLALLGLSLAAPIDAFIEAMNAKPAAPAKDRKEAQL